MRLTGLVSGAWMRALQNEAAAHRATAEERARPYAIHTGYRASDPAQHFANAGGGEVLQSVYHDATLSNALSVQTGRALRPTGDQGSYSYYDAPGHFLGLHRDINTCDVTLILCLRQRNGDVPSGALRTYPKSVRDDLEALTGDTPHRDIAMTQGDAVLLLGGVIPHEVLPAARGYLRHIAVMCFEMQSA